MSDFIFGAYPYLAGTIFAVGCWIRFDREQYTWKADSSQLLDNTNMRLYSNLFHVGVIGIFLGHFVGLLTPHSWFLALGISDLAHQNIAIYAGSAFGIATLVGAGLLARRRLTVERIKAVSRGRDNFVILLIAATAFLGLMTVPASMYHASHQDASTMLALSEYLKSVVTLSVDPTLLKDVSFVYKLHMFFGMTLVLIFPFTRMVHIWSVPISYIGRAYQIVRTRKQVCR
ncbi:MAG: respiratory nitrate reductase subunit gamma [Candidatus Polarisedimenticolaceae bacterium]|nr:respiratory nitrate reductase subunit gamma [Candidatus Polarisedimenticolaceae bacterium]